MSTEEVVEEKETFLLQVITPEGVALEKEVLYSKLPGETGEVGVYVNHTPTLLSCHPGKILTKEPNGEIHKYFIPSGYSEITKEKVTVLAPYIENADKINPERAEEAKKRALDRLHSNDESIDRIRARKALFRAERRIYIYNLKNKNKNKN